MEMGSRIRWAAVIVAVILLLVGSMIGIVLIARNIFNSGSNDTSQSEQTASLLDFNRPGITLGLEVQGPVVAKEKATSYRLKVGRTERVAQLIRGYDGFIEKEERVDNTEESFSVFLKALEHAGFDRVDGTENDDEQGACATGQRYILTIEDEGIEVFRAWKTSCGEGIGNSTAPKSVRTLFKKQFPNFAKFVSGTGLN